jgi:hypothetical protein
MMTRQSIHRNAARLPARWLALLVALAMLLALATSAALAEAGDADQPANAAPAPAADADSDAPRIRCAMLIHGDGVTAYCFAPHFLKRIAETTHIRTTGKFAYVDLASAELFEFPFAVLSGEQPFTLDAQQQSQLRAYLLGGGFVVASAGCSNADWDRSFRRAIAEVLPEYRLERLPLSHPIMHTVYDIDRLRSKRLGGQPTLEAITIDGRIVLLYSPDGLNDSVRAPGDCCCCGGNELINAMQINANALAYALTH